MSETVKTSKNLIDQLLENAESVIEKAKRPFVKKKINRSFDSAIESVEEQKIDAELALNNIRKDLIQNPENANDYINQLAKEKQIIIDADKTIEVLKSEKNILFS